MTVFLTEALVRAKLYREGIGAYFSNLWNSMDTLLIFISAVFEVIDLLHFLQLKWLIPILATMRLISSLRTIGMLYKKAIDAELLINELLEDTIHQLNYELDIKDSDQARLIEELAAKRKKILQTENDSQVVKSKMITAQRSSWGSLVPATYGITSVSRPSSKDSTQSFISKLH
ncbi:hypothetical protein DSO57_1007982 [Entomophthora muscae]|uniref:Uncharacterized protein n=1 Tax=Entomophthora muscae TaxID=34485 RepID=A0ACC2TIF8_9FUNG|nr:hypothetical protein DSO57_1007982 [Entomophthora muscae]